MRKTTQSVVDICVTAFARSIYHVYQHQNTFFASRTQITNQFIVRRLFRRRHLSQHIGSGRFGRTVGRSLRHQHASAKQQGSY